MEPTCLATGDPTVTAAGLMTEGLMAITEALMTEAPIEALTETNSREPSRNNKHQLK